GCNAGIRSEGKGGLLYDTSILSESLEGGTQVAVASAPVSLSRRDPHRDRCLCKSGLGSRMSGHRSWWHKPRFDEVGGYYVKESATHPHRGSRSLQRPWTVSGARDWTLYEQQQNGSGQDGGS